MPNLLTTVFLDLVVYNRGRVKGEEGCITPEAIHKKGEAQTFNETVRDMGE